MPRRGEFAPVSRLCLVALSLLGCFSAGCGGDKSSTHPPVINNNPPVVERMFTIPERVHADQEVVVIATIHDADNDRLRYRWSCTRGTLPDGNVLASTTWQTPLTRGRDTLRVRVSDAADSAIGLLPVDLVLPDAPPEVTLATATNLLEVRWRPSLDQGINGWKGYEIYVADHSLVGMTEEEILPFRLRDSVFDEPNLALRILRLRDGTPLRTGSKYFVHLRALRQFAGITERSEASVEVDGAPRPEWVQSGFDELRHRLGAGALDLSAGRLLELDPADSTGIAQRDVYLDSGEGAPLELRSVSKLAGLNPKWASRTVSIKRLGTDWDVSTTTDDGWSDAIALEEDAVYAIKLPEGNYAKLLVADIAGFAPNRQVQVLWAYQTIPDYPRF